jgi:hypothetical protein
MHIGIVINHQETPASLHRPFIPGQPARFRCGWRFDLGGQGESESRAFTQCALDRDGAVHQFSEVLGDGKAQACAAILAGGGGFALSECLEKFAYLLFRLHFTFGFGLVLEDFRLDQHSRQRAILPIRCDTSAEDDVRSGGEALADAGGLANSHARARPGPPLWTQMSTSPGGSLTSRP